jgi:type II secretory ATPase GspE/PulE/Tfp pilus assembly ATPase PilB-like protein
MESIEILNNVPDALKGRVALSEGVLHISSELKGNIDLVNLHATLRRRGILDYQFHKPDEFDANYASHSKSFGQKNLNENEILNYAINLILKAFESGASDIHIMDYGSYTIIRFRCLGMLTDYAQLSPDYGKHVIACIYQKMAQSADATFSPNERQDGRIVKRSYLPPSVHSIRVHSEPIECVGESGIGTSMSLRLLYDATSAKGTLNERLSTLGFTNDQCNIFEFLTRRTGLTIISGPTGHGKSTVLKHIMECMTDRNPEKAYFSIEDPAEYPLRGVRQVKVKSSDQYNRAKEYENAIAGAMRSDPDVLMIGEIRYAEAAQAAIDAALTGHAVWATLHANNAFGIIPRMVSILTSLNIINPLEMLCDQNVLAGLEYQRLIPILCPKCKLKFAKLSSDEKRHYMPEDVLKRINRAFGDNVDTIYIRGTGCEHCKRRGFIGQTVAAEIVDTDQQILTYLRSNEISKAYDYWLSQKNGKSYVDHAKELILDGIIDPFIAEERLGVPLNFTKVFIEGGCQ